MPDLSEFHEYIMKHERELGHIINAVSTIESQNEKITKNLELINTTLIELGQIVKNQQNEIKEMIRIKESLNSIEHRLLEINKLNERVSKIESKIDYLGPINDGLKTITGKAILLIITVLMFMVITNFVDKSIISLFVK